MTDRRDVSVKGYYYNLEKSPYVWISSYGDSFHLPSAKKLEMMEKRVPVALRRLDKFLDAHNLRDIMPAGLDVVLEKLVVDAVYEELIRR